MKNEEAVSPVIGVILMVAITVILAAVIAAFVFGLVGSQWSAKNIGLVVSQNTDGYAVVTVQGGSDLPSLNQLTLKVLYPSNNTVIKSETFDGPFTVGYVFNNTESIKSRRLIITGKFSDGSEQIIIDRNY